MSKLSIVVPIVTFIAGAISGGIGVDVWRSKQPREKEVVEVVVREPIPAELTPPKNPAPELVPAVPKIEVKPNALEKKAWVPVAGEECRLFEPGGQQIGSAKEPMYLIPRDVAALSRMIKYLKARDVRGALGLLEEGRIVWSPKPISVLVISVNDRLGIAEVRTQSYVYNCTFRNFVKF